MVNGAAGELPLLAMLHGINGKVCLLNALYGLLRLLCIGNVGLFAIQRSQLCGKVQLPSASAMQLGFDHDLPVFLRDERLNILLAHHNHAGRNALNTTGGQTLFHLGPQRGLIL